MKDFAVLYLKKINTKKNKKLADPSAWNFVITAFLKTLHYTYLTHSPLIYSS